MGGLGLMQGQISKQTHDDLGANGWEINAHAASAPDHEPIQGKQYSDEEYETLNSSLVRRIGTLNCGHAAFPIILGVTPPQYTKEELEKYRLDNERGIDYAGKHYTMYEATQRQRRLEASMRRQKRRILADEANGDQEKKQQDQIKLQVLNQEYRRFSKAAGLRTQDARAEVAGFSAKKGFTKIANTVDVSPKSAIISTDDGKGVADVRHIARVDIKKFEGISKNILTDEVILTDERAKHIEERRGADFLEKYERYFPSVLTEPDYIFKDDRINTAIVCKIINEDDGAVNLILRLAVEGDNPSYKNSILTAIRENNRRFEQRLRNNNPVYKKV